MLGIVYGLQRFHHYVFGQHVTIHSDQKPLEELSTRNVANAPPGIARMLLHAQVYSFACIGPGKDVSIADALPYLPNEK